MSANASLSFFATGWTDISLPISSLKVCRQEQPSALALMRYPMHVTAPERHPARDAKMAGILPAYLADLETDEGLPKEVLAVLDLAATVRASPLAEMAAQITEALQARASHSPRCSAAVHTNPFVW
jgi:hypothetical protein